MLSLKQRKPIKTKGSKQLVHKEACIEAQADQIANPDDQTIFQLLKYKKIIKSNPILAIRGN